MNPKNAEKEMLASLSEAIVIAEGALRNANAGPARPKFINRRSQPYGSGKTYPRSTSHDRQKNQVAYHNHIDEIQKLKKAIVILEEVLIMLNAAKSDLNNKTNTSDIWNHLEKLISYHNSKSHLDHNVDTYYFKHIINQVLDFLDRSYPTD